MGKKQELFNKQRPLVVTFPNSYLRNKLIKAAFKLKYTPYLISVDRTVEERSLYKKVLNKRNEMQNKDHSGEWEYKIRGPPWNPKIRAQ